MIRSNTSDADRRRTLPTKPQLLHNRARRAGRARPVTDPYSSRLWMLAVLTCSLAIASVPVFSRQVGLSFIPQLLALGAVGMAGIVCLLLNQIPKFHPAIIAYLCLVAMWGFTVPEDPIERAQYISLVKLAGLVIASHVLIRLPRHLIILLGIYTIAGVFALILNWSEIREIKYAVATGEATADATRLAGTFVNANTAGVFAAFAALSGVIVFYNTNHFARWGVLVSGVTSGLLVGGLAGSRTGLLGLLITGLSVPLLALSGKREDLMNKWLKGTLLVALALGVALATLTQLPQFERLTRLTEGVRADASTDTRWRMARESARVWMEYPITGAGFQGFQKVSQFEGYSHTTFGEVLANAGLVGIFLIAVIYMVPGVQFIRIARYGQQPADRRLAVALLVFWAVFCLVSLFAVMHIRRDIMPMWAAICGLIPGQIRRIAGSSRSNKKPDDALGTRAHRLR